MKLLSIAIPTFNRSHLLRESLGRILPQIVPHRQEIELIISNNCSSDNTANVIDCFRERYPDVHFVVNTNEANLGIARNYEVCRRLSVGKYLWILSDDDFLSDGTISKIISILREHRAAIVFLDTWSTANEFLTEDLSFDTFIRTVRNKFTLVSCSIYLNEKKNDDHYRHRFIANSFLCFWYTINSLEHYDTVVRILGQSLDVKHEPTHSYDAIKAFSTDIIDVLDYMSERALITAAARKILFGDLIKFQLFQNLLSYRLTNRHVKYRYLFKSRLMGYGSFWIYILPASIIPSPLLKVLVALIRKIR